MGTFGDWIEVLLMGAGWGAFMFWISQPIDPEERKKLRSLTIQVCALGGLVVGLVTTFGMSSLRWPQVSVSLPAFVLLVMVSARRRKELRSLRASGSSIFD